MGIKLSEVLAPWSYIWTLSLNRQTVPDILFEDPEIKRSLLKMSKNRSLLTNLQNYLKNALFQIRSALCIIKPRFEKPFRQMKCICQQLTSLHNALSIVYKYAQQLFTLCMYVFINGSYDNSNMNCVFYVINGLNYIFLTYRTIL